MLGWTSIGDEVSRVLVGGELFDVQGRFEESWSRRAASFKFPRLAI